jgi:hypothetical protein
MEVGGWKSERMVLRYAHVNVGHLRPHDSGATLGKIRGARGTAGDFASKVINLTQTGNYLAKVGVEGSNPFARSKMP